MFGFRRVPTASLLPSRIIFTVDLEDPVGVDQQRGVDFISHCAYSGRDEPAASASISHDKSERWKQTKDWERQT